MHLFEEDRKVKLMFLVISLPRFISKSHISFPKQLLLLEDEIRYLANEKYNLFKGFSGLHLLILLITH